MSVISVPTPKASSRQIQALEKKLGVQLLRRNAPTVELTLPGEVLLEIFHSGDTMWHESRGQRVKR